MFDPIQASGDLYMQYLAARVGQNMQQANAHSPPSAGVNLTTPNLYADLASVAMTERIQLYAIQRRQRVADGGGLDMSV